MDVFIQSFCVLGSDRIAQLLAVIHEAAGHPGFLNGFENCWKPLQGAAEGKQPCLLQGNLGFKLLAFPHTSHTHNGFGQQDFTSKFLGYVLLVKNASSSGILLNQSVIRKW